MGVARAVTVTFRGLCDCHQSPPSNGPRMTAMTACGSCEAQPTDATPRRPNAGSG